MKLVFACLCIGSNSISDSDWESYKNEFGKAYNNDNDGENGVETEDDYRRGIFEQNLVQIADLNAQESLAHYGPTKFTDMKTEEYINGYKPEEQLVRHKLEIQPVTLAAARDWTGKYTTAIKDQGSCGSCWAESATSQVESDAMREHGFTGMLSVQELVDCEGSGQGSWRGGCDGGSTGTGYKVLMSLGGVASAYDYKYTAKDMACTINNYNKYVQVVSYHYVGENDENAMKSYVSSTGPLSVCVDANSWGSYRNGIKTTCGTSVDHCVQIVGFGTQDSTDYWKVRNSWGGTWGENGHIRLKIGHNLCKISSDPTATSTKVLSTPPVPHQTCTDKAWHSSEGDPCSTYELNSYCTADGQEGEGWNSCEWGRLVNYADSHGVSAFDACCGCGGGSTGESAESSVRSPALTNATSASSCTDVPHWRSSEGDSCCKYPWESYCTADGKEGPGWKSSWGRISDYSDSNGVSATDACCGCGGGSRSVVV